MTGEWRVYRSARVPNAPYRVEIVWRGQMVRRLYCVRPFERSTDAFVFADDEHFSGEEGERIEVEAITFLRESGSYLNFTVDDGRIRRYSLMRVGAASVEAGKGMVHYLLRCDIEARTTGDGEPVAADLEVVTCLRKRDQLPLEGIRVRGAGTARADYLIMRGDALRAAVNVMSVQELVHRMQDWESLSRSLSKLALEPRATLLISGDLHEVAGAPSLLTMKRGEERLAKLILLDNLKVVFAGSRKMASMLLRQMAAQIGLEQGVVGSQGRIESPEETVRRIVGEQGERFTLGDIAQAMPATNPLSIRRELNRMVEEGELALIGKNTRKGFRKLSLGEIKSVSAPKA